MLGATASQVRRHRDNGRTRPADPRPARSARLGAWVVSCAIVTVAALGGQLLHMTLVAHAICPSHGEVVHEAHHDEHDTELASARPVVAEPDDDGHHGHCDAVGVTAALVSPPSPPAPTQHLTWAEARESRGVDVVASRRRRLLLAPKTPPPA